ncbi:MAG: hypothetical protein D8M57_17235 [Candidatus Scalindua sp. AMX11]|nr:MAG: hypothetical protein DWQ00_10290 [Candidatus Scalindua sp.]NOG82318.1 hypothetical protein [Planctomycetota bacterium]RZV66645.1 MAG: hypothetical protein EX341_17360 [Candidatus Scalindua sp. SCAELEC01]TDE63622.1 MAG: hypothetical protein D8M57_17235 [Candidatus Scalindua sp. AMX11]GJQ59987.1 MAG: hypothetical protein SCALA701_27880 [Candidatus Scalindua sp.]
MNSSDRKIFYSLRKFICFGKGVFNPGLCRILILTLFSISIVGSLMAREDDTVIVLNSDVSIDKYSVVHTEFKSRIINLADEIDLGSKWLDEEKVKKKILEVDPDIIYCIGSKAYQMAYKLRKGRKLVFSLMINWKRFPVRKNVYGISNELPQIMQLTMYRYFFPDINKIGVLYSKAYNVEWYKNTVKIAKEVGVDVIGRSIKNPDDIKSAVNKLLPDVDAVWLIPDPVVIRDVESVKVIFETSKDAKIPVFAYDKAFTGFGAALIISADISTMGKQAAGIVQEILTEGKISERVQNPAGSFIILNIKKVEEYDLRFNIEALDSVNEIIE